MQPITIIGSGLAGYTVAKEFRNLNKDAPLRLITKDAGDFYSKPMLSNAFSQNKSLESLVTTTMAQMAQQYQIEIVPHSKVTRLEPHSHQLTVNRQQLEYSQLVLAWGAEQIQLPLKVPERKYFRYHYAEEKIFSVNNLVDYKRFRAALTVGKRIAIMGAGLIGCEFANDLQPAGFTVTLIDITSQPLGRLVPAAVGQVLQEALQELGVNFRLNQGVKVIHNIENGYRLELTNNTVLETDIVLSAAGLRPHTALAAETGLAVKRGIVVDRYLKTNVPDVYALGDCAEVEGLVLPYVMPLMNAARALAKTLAGQTTAVTYPAMPIVIKTPACPLVVSPPAIGVEGQWQIEGENRDIKALFYTPSQQLAGFALTGKRVAEKMALTKELPPILT